jgi:hypothetical protein
MGVWGGSACMMLCHGNMPCAYCGLQYLLNMVVETLLIITYMHMLSIPAVCSLLSLWQFITAGNCAACHDGSLYGTKHKP